MNSNPRVINLTNKQSVSLAIKGFIDIDGEVYYKKKKFLYLNEAIDNCDVNEIITRAKHMNYVLSKTYINENRPAVKLQF
jgi:hypothetical protein